MKKLEELVRKTTLINGGIRVYFKPFSGGGHRFYSRFAKQHGIAEGKPFPIANANFNDFQGFEYPMDIFYWHIINERYKKNKILVIDEKNGDAERAIDVRSKLFTRISPQVAITREREVHKEDIKRRKRIRPKTTWESMKMALHLMDKFKIVEEEKTYYKDKDLDEPIPILYSQIVPNGPNEPMRIISQFGNSVGFGRDARFGSSSRNYALPESIAFEVFRLGLGNPLAMNELLYNVFLEQLFSEYTPESKELFMGSGCRGHYICQQSEQDNLLIGQKEDMPEEGVSKLKTINYKDGRYVEKSKNDPDYYIQNK